MSLSQVAGLRSLVAKALRKPCTASTKHKVQLKMNPMVVISAALASKPAETQAKPGQYGALITTIGFILSCTLCFVLAVQGLRSAFSTSDRRPVTWLKDVLIGLAISAPVYWSFTKFLAINLPGLTKTGWL